MRIVEEILYSLKKNSNLIALKIGNREITYRELDKLSDAALVWLHSKGVRQEASVLIMTKEYQNFIILALAALKGGITYVPIASEMPNERLSSICFYCNTNVIITDFDYQGQNFGIYLQFSESILEFGLSDYTNYYCKPSDDHIIYVIFTSGSTGIPKGVEITSKAISNYLSWARDYYDIGIPLVFPVFTSISFDLSITSMFLPVLTGGTCILLNIEDSYEKLGRLSELEVINTMKLTPSHLMILNEMDLLNMKELKQVIVGGEALKKQVVQQFVSKFNRNIRVINEYGPTEATVGCMFYEYSMYDKEDIVPIGNPIDNVSLYILDERGNLITGEAEGELFISGDSLAKGYANNPLQTGERFFYDNTLNKMLYKTGDVVRRDNLGKYHYIGRVDRQVKLGGHRIELNEIDFSISQFSKDLSPITIFDSDRNKIITFLKSNIEYSLNNIEKYLKDRLPYYMLPQLVKIDTVPLTINGKIDEKSLLDSLLFQDNEDEELKGDYFETIIYRLFIKTLNRNSFLMTQNYFELGGNSIGAMRILSNLNKQISEKITMKDFLKNSSVKELSHLLKSKGNRRNHALNEDNIYFKNELLDLSPNERGIVFKELLNFENNTLWNIPYLWEISAPLDVKRLEFAIYKIIERYDILRTNYVYNDSDFQRNINTTILNNVFEHIVVNSSDNIEEIIKQFIEPFNIHEGNLFKIKYIEHNSKNYIFFDIHHIISDGRSQIVFFKKLKEIYELGETTVVNGQYLDYVQWQISKDWTIDKEYWNNYLKKPVTTVTLEVGGQGIVDDVKNSELKTFYLNTGITKNLKKIAVDNKITLFILLSSIITYTFMKFSNSDEIAILTQFSGREKEEFEEQLGLFTNPVPLLFTYENGDSLDSFISKAARKLINVYDHQYYPYLYISKDYYTKFNRELDKDINIVIVFQENISLEGFNISNSSFKNINIENVSNKKDLTIILEELNGEIQIKMEYSTNFISYLMIEKISSTICMIVDEYVKSHNT